MEMDQEKFNKVIEAARMYYILDYNQSEIAKSLVYQGLRFLDCCRQQKKKALFKLKLWIHLSIVKNCLLSLNKNSI